MSALQAGKTSSRQPNLAVWSVVRGEPGAARLVEASVPLHEALDVEAFPQLERVDAAALHRQELVGRHVAGDPQLSPVPQVFAQLRGDTEEAAVGRVGDIDDDQPEALNVVGEICRIGVDRKADSGRSPGAPEVGEEIAALLAPTGGANREVAVGRRVAVAQMLPGIGALPAVHHEPRHRAPPP